MFGATRLKLKYRTSVAKRSRERLLRDKKAIASRAAAIVRYSPYFTAAANATTNAVASANSTASKHSSLSPMCQLAMSEPPLRLLGCVPHTANVSPNRVVFLFACIREKARQRLCGNWHRTLLKFHMAVIRTLDLYGKLGDTHSERDRMPQEVGPSFDPKTLTMLKRVLNETEQALPIQARTSEIRVQIASGILAAAADGERDPARLRSAGLSKIDRRIVTFGASWLD
jgi:hypothetical protein